MFKSVVVLGWPKNAFGPFHMIFQKMNFWPTQQIYSSGQAANIPEMSVEV